MYTQLQLRDSARPPVTLTTLQKMRASGEPIAALTCYDASFAVLLDEANVDQRGNLRQLISTQERDRQTNHRKRPVWVLFEEGMAEYMGTAFGRRGGEGQQCWSW